MNDEAIFATVPEISEETKRHAELQLAHYIWYEGNGSRWKREYHCSCCHADWRHEELDVITPKDETLRLADHGEEVVCPRCGEAAKLMCLGRCRSGYRYNQAFGVQVLAAVPGNPDEVWIRTFRMSRKYGGYAARGYGVHFRARPEWEEMARHRLVPGEAAYWCRTYYSKPKLERAGRIEDYYRSTNWTDVVDSSASLFILQTPLSYSFLQYCAWDQYNCKRVTSPARYLCAYAEHPQIEMFVKLGYGEQVHELVMERRKNVRCINWDAANPPAAFRMSKAEFAEWQKRGGEFDLRKLWQVYRKQQNAWELAKLEYDFDQKVGSWIKADVKKLAKAGGVEMQQLFRYFARKAEETGRTYSTIVSKWKDYADTAEGIGWKLSEKRILMPKDIFAAHDEVMEIRAAIKAEEKAKEARKKEEGFRKHLPRYTRKYTASDGVYMIRVPESTREIVDEGQALDHCVGHMNYIRNMAEGKNAIVFLRRCAEPDRPWYTLEVSPKRVVQCEGARRNDGKAGYYGHLYRDDLPEDAKAFLDAWEARVCQSEEKTDERKDIA